MQFGRGYTTVRGNVVLGDEPPLQTGNNRPELPDRRQVSLRWLAGTVLTGVTSLFLMGGALTAALDGQYIVAAATAPDVIGSGLGPADGGAGAKGDRAFRATAEYSNTHVIDVNVVTRVGDRDHIKVRPHVLISTTLTTRADPELSAQIPGFNPMEMFADSQSSDDTIPNDSGSSQLIADSIYGAKLENEVSISLTEFPLKSALIDPDLEPSDSEVELHVREVARTLSVDSIAMASKTLVDPGRFDFNLALQPNLERFAVRITPENVSFVSKRDEALRFAGMEEKIIPVSADMNLTDVLLDNNASAPDAEQIAHAFGSEFGLTSLSDGQRVRIAFAPDPANLSQMRPERVSLYAATRHEATVARSDRGDYVRAQAPATFLADAFAEADRVSYGGPTPTIYKSLYHTALEQDLPTSIISDLVRIFSFDVDFKARVHPGDSLELFYTTDEDDPTPKVLYASLNTGDTTRSFYRFRTPDDGVLDFYDGAGHSAKKFLVRKPLNGGNFRSGFGMRRHPILRIRKMHRGVDWAAPRGTPIFAAGNGTILEAGWASGYGRRIELQHTNGYVTTYSHMTRLAKGMREGVRVNQGEVIGYVGSTGLSTGPHLHYEVLVNGRYVDPMRIKLPKGRVLDGKMFETYFAERTRIDTLLDQARKPSRIASLK